MSDEILINQMARVKDDVRPKMSDAVVAIIALCWDARREGFSFADFPDLEKRANEILVKMSDGILSEMERRAKLALIEEELQEYEEESLSFVENEERYGETVLFRIDREADHLKELLAGWLAVAALTKMTRNELERDFWVYLGDVTASPKWRESGVKPPRWGKGYQANLLNGFTVIGQDMVNRAYQYARVQDFGAKGAVGYRTIRNSNYHCPLCDEMTRRIWNLNEVVLPYHARCVCSAVPVYPDDLVL